MAKKALVIVDMLHDFVDENGALPITGLKTVVPNIRLLKEAAEDKGLLVVYANDAHPENDPEFKIYGRHAVKGEYGARVVDELAPKKNYLIVEKQDISMFTNKDTDRMLKYKGIEELIITGGATEYCVRGAALNGRDNKYQVTVVVDAIAGIDINKGDQYRALLEMGNAEVKPAYTKQVLEEIIRK